MLPVTRRRFLQRCIVSSLLGSVAFRAAAQQDSMAACTSRLRMVFESLEAFRRANGQYPGKLAELVERGYLSHERQCLCPVTEQTNLLIAVAPGIASSTKFDKRNSYEYELDDSVRINQTDAPGLTDLTRRGWKTCLMEGPLKKVAPLLRCQLHNRKAVNVTATGDVYLSGQYWELEFVDLLPEVYTMPFMAHRRPLAISQYAARRPAPLPANCLDLEAAGNALPEDPWLEGVLAGDTLEALLAILPQELSQQSLPAFDTRYLIQVCGKFGTEKDWESHEKFGAHSYPTRSKAIHFQAPAGSRLHILHACAYPDKPGQKAGGVHIKNTESGAEQSIDFVYGRDTAVWRGESSHPELKPVCELIPSAKGVPQRLFCRSCRIDCASSDVTPLELRIEADPASTAGPFIVGLSISS